MQILDLEIEDEKSENEGGVKGRLELFRKFIRLMASPVPDVVVEQSIENLSIS